MRCPFGPLPVLVGLSGLMGIVSLVLSLYAASAARKAPMLAMGDAVITRSPRDGPKGTSFKGHMFAGSGYYAPGAEMKYSRSDFRALAVGPQVFLVGGLTNDRDAGPEVTSDGVVIPNLVRYDTYTGLILELRPMPEPRYRFAAATDGNAIYVVSGLSTTDPDNHRPVPRTLRFDFSANEWTLMPGRPATPRSDACAAVADGKLYLFGGWGANYTVPPRAEVMDLASGRWSPLPEGMTPRGDCEAAALPAESDCVLVMGGWGDAVSNAAECWRPKKGKWERMANMTRARGDFAAELLPGGRVLVMGGEAPGRDNKSNENAIADVEMYIAADNVWVPMAPLPEARFRFDAAHVGDRVVVFGGHPTCTSLPKEDPGAIGRQSCVQVALNSTWSFYNIDHPNAYIWTKG